MLCLSMQRTVVVYSFTQSSLFLESSVRELSKFLAKEEDSIIPLPKHCNVIFLTTCVSKELYGVL